MKNLKLRLTLIAVGLILVSMLLGLLAPRVALDASDQIKDEHLAVAAFVFLGPVSYTHLTLPTILRV